MRMNDVQFRQATVIAVTGGKGGVGKTNVAINVAAGLSRYGHRVALIDGDFGLGSVDVMLGLTPRAHVGHVLSGERTLSEVLLDGPCGVRILPAASGVQPLTTLTAEQRARLDAALAEARATHDFLIIDTAPGIGDHVVTMLTLAQHVLLVTSTDPAAMVDAYAVAKVLWQIAPGAQISLVANGVRNDAEGRQAFRQIDRAAVRFLGHNLRYLGSVPDDQAVRDAIVQQRALLEHLPQAPASRSLRLIATRLATLSASPGGLRLMPRAGDTPDPEVWRCA
jgi:flagellar biosynthesis protein FlhG